MSEGTPRHSTDLGSPSERVRSVFCLARRVDSVTGRVINPAAYEEVEKRFPAFAAEIAKLVGRIEASSHSAVARLAEAIERCGFVKVAFYKPYPRGEGLWNALASEPLTVTLEAKLLYLTCGDFRASMRESTSDDGASGHGTVQTARIDSAIVTDLLGQLKGVIQDSEKRVLETTRQRFDEITKELSELRAEIRNAKPNQPSLSGSEGREEGVPEESSSWRKKVEEYVTAIESALRLITEDAVKATWGQVAERLRHEGADKGVAGGALPAGPISHVTLRDTTMVLVDAVMEKTERSLDKSIHETVRRLEQLAELSPIAPESGAKADAAVHEWDPQPVSSSYPKGSVVRVVRRGYRWEGELYRKARVVISAGADEGPPKTSG
jgi:hypothetical protein